MKFEESQLYHMYNRGNSKERIFLAEKNYDFFISKIRKFILPHCDLIAWCLMPNHFHFMIHADNRTTAIKEINSISKNALSDGFRHLLRSYTKVINVQNNSTGSLFQQNTKSKNLTSENSDYPLACIYYIHQNPVKAWLIQKIEASKFSSFNEYLGISGYTLCSNDKAYELLNIGSIDFYTDSHKRIEESNINMNFD